MPFCLACWITGFSAAASAGLAMIALAPAEIRLRIAAICSGAPPFWFWTMTLLTLPLAAACALIEQIISSRKPLPTSVLLTPITYFLPESPPLVLLPVLAPVPALALPVLESSSPLPHPATARAPTPKPIMRHLVPHFLILSILLSSPRWNKLLRTPRLLQWDP